MEELRRQRDSESPNEDARSARNASNWFARQLGDEWEAAEPGIYRYVGPSTPIVTPRSVPDVRDGTDRSDGHRRELDGERHPEFEREEQRRTG